MRVASKDISAVSLVKEALEKVYEKVGYFADKEGLGAHAKSARIRFAEEK